MILNLIKIRIFFVILLLFISPSLFKNRILASPQLTKYSNNPIVTPDQESWDSDRTWQPSVVHNGTNFLMLYSGRNSNGRFQIGLATSSDGLIWTKHPSNPVITKIESENKDTHDPSLLFENGYYQAWFVGSDNGGNDNYSIYRATSNDGVSWTNNPSTPVFRPTNTWGSGGVTSPSVIKVGTLYIMWFSSSDDGHFKIGRATSTDGINWITDNNNPILIPDSQWDGPDIDGPAVLYDGIRYEMYYQSQGKINFAYSDNGNTWIKSQSDNPVLSQSQSFDLVTLHAPSILSTNSTNRLLYYDGLGYDNNAIWRIGIASTEMVTQPSPTLTPIPTQTTTPTLTPTSTPTPTPTTMPTRKIVVIPGTFASWNSDALVNCKVANYEGDWQFFPPAKSIYQPLIKSFESNHYTPLIYTFDWRRPISTHGENLQGFINSHTTPGEKVNLVGHSMGGLLGRAYLDHALSANRLDKFLTVGSPHHGALFAYPAWSGGEIIGDRATRLFTKLLLKFCQRKNPGMTNREIVQTFVPSAGDILPDFDYLRDKRTNNLKSILNMDAQNYWLSYNLFTAPFYGVYVGSLSGTDKPTPREYFVRDPGPRDLRLGNWSDGKPDGKTVNGNGDETVLLSSSNVLGASQNLFLKKSHTDLIKSKDGVNTILNFFGPAPAPLTSSEPANEPNSSLTVISYPAAMEITDPDGQKQTDTDGLINQDNPRRGIYNVSVKPKSENTSIYIFQWLPGGKEVWKEYKLKGKSAKKFRLHFDPVRPKSDPLTSTN